MAVSFREYIFFCRWFQRLLGTFSPRNFGGSWSKLTRIFLSNGLVKNHQLGKGVFVFKEFKDSWVSYMCRWDGHWRLVVTDFVVTFWWPKEKGTSFGDEGQRVCEFFVFFPARDDEFHTLNLFWSDVFPWDNTHCLIAGWGECVNLLGNRFLWGSCWVCWEKDKIHGNLRGPPLCHPPRK